MRAEYEEIYEAIGNAPGPREQMALMEELVRLADANNDLEVAYEARRGYVSMAVDEGFPEKAIVAFSWCLAQFDKNEQLDYPGSLLWQYKTILELIPIFDTISLERIVRLQEDMSRRLSQYNLSQRTALYYRSWNTMRTGDYDAALGYQEQYVAMARDEMSDCEACERDRQVELLSRMHTDDQALKRAHPILNGRMRCSEVPHFTNGHIVKSMVRLGQDATATARAERGYALAKSNRKYLGTIGDLLLITIRNRELDKGLRRFTKHLPWAAQCAAGELRFRYYSAGALLLEACCQAGQANKKLTIPRELACYREEGKYDLPELREWFSAEAIRLAGRFNQRNGNERYDQLLVDNRQLAGLG